MGDALRNAIAVSGSWTHEDRKLYALIALKELGPIYAVENIPKNEPANRARYWDLKLKIEDNGKEEEEVLKIFEKQNRAMALRALEEIAFKRFF